MYLGRRVEEGDDEGKNGRKRKIDIHMYMINLNEC